jgi:hypothetical protein
MRLINLLGQNSSTMKVNMKKLFSFSVTETEKIIEIKEKIELVSCPLKEMMCKFHLSVVNMSYLKSEQYRIEKDYNKSIDTLKSAFYKTCELMDHPCTRCAQLYRSNIVESLENIHNELEMMSTGIFGNKRYHSSYVKADSVLKEFENAGFGKKFQLNESKEQFLGNYLN